MRRRFSRQLRAGYTLVEMMVATAVFASIGGMVYNFFSAGTFLYAKNVSVNFSNSYLRSALDRVNFELSQATDVPELLAIAANGTISTTTTAGAGIRFDKYRGGPYIMENTGTATATTFSMKRSTDALVTAPLPASGDVVLINGSLVRSIVASCTPGSIAASLQQSLAITLQSGSTTGVAWTATKKPANLVREVAFIVVGNELRFYHSMEGVSVYNSAPSTYSVITRDIGTSTALNEDKPFTLVTKNGKTYVNLSVRVQNREFSTVLANKESKEFNTSLRIDTLIRPRNAP